MYHNCDVYHNVSLFVDCLLSPIAFILVCLIYTLEPSISSFVHLSFNDILLFLRNVSVIILIFVAMMRINEYHINFCILPLMVCFF